MSGWGQLVKDGGLEVSLSIDSPDAKILGLTTDEDGHGSLPAGPRRDYIAFENWITSKATCEHGAAWGLSSLNGTSLRKRRLAPQQQIFSQHSGKGCTTYRGRRKKCDVAFPEYESTSGYE
jgi:hypothetical protein